MAIKDLIEVLPLIGAVVAVAAWLDRRKRKWTTEHISDPLKAVAGEQTRIAAEQAKAAHLLEYHLGPNSGATKMVDRVVENAKVLDEVAERQKLQGARLRTLEIVHHTEGITPAAITEMLLQHLLQSDQNTDTVPTESGQEEDRP